MDCGFGFIDKTCVCHKLDNDCLEVSSMLNTQLMGICFIKVIDQIVLSENGGNIMVIVKIMGRRKVMCILVGNGCGEGQFWLFSHLFD